jgi:hypothetical protein
MPNSFAKTPARALKYRAQPLESEIAANRSELALGFILIRIIRAVYSTGLSVVFKNLSLKENEKATSRLLANSPEKL